MGGKEREPQMAVAFSGRSVQDLEVENLETESLKTRQVPAYAFKKIVWSQRYPYSTLKAIIEDNEYFAM